MLKLKRHQVRCVRGSANNGSERQGDKYRKEWRPVFMRLAEFTSAQDQLALWKLISDNVWRSINSQAQQQAQAAAQQKRVVKPKAKVASKVKIPRAPAPKPLPQPKPLYPAKAPIAKAAPAAQVSSRNRLANQSTAKTANLTAQKMASSTVARGIATKDSPPQP